MTQDLEIKWLRIAAIIPSAAMIFMDQSILPVALPVIQKEFAASESSLQWSVNSYLLTWTVFLLICGKLGDRIGHRRTYLLGMALFALFSALCSMSSTIEFLIAARALQGVGAAMMLPSQTSLIATSFPVHSRGRVTGVIVSLGALFLVIGPMVGGLLTDWLSWRWIFWINLPMAALGLLLSWALLPPVPGKGGKIDFLGFFFFAGFASLLAIFFMQAQDWGWGSRRIVALGLLSGIALIFLIRREKKSGHPFLQLKLFRRPVFSAININIALTQFILMVTIFRTIYTENILGYTPLETGLITSVASLPVLFFSYIGGYLSDKVSPKLPIALGYICLILSFFWLGFVPTPTLPQYFFALLLFGAGIPLVFTPSYTVAMSTVPKDQLGAAFGMIITLRMFAATIGLALIFAFVSMEQGIYLPKVGKKIAEITSFSSVHFLLGCLMIVAFLASFFLHHRKSAHHLPDAPSEGWD